MEELLSKVLSEEAEAGRLVRWLRNPGFVQDDDVLIRCSRTDFVLYFLSFLRTQSSSVLQQSSSLNNSATIKIVPPEKNKIKPNDEILMERTFSIEKTSPSRTIKHDCETHSHSHHTTSTTLHHENKDASHNYVLENKPPAREDHNVDSPVTPNNSSLDSCLSNVSPISQENSGIHRPNSVIQTPANSTISNKSPYNQSTPFKGFVNSSPKTDHVQNAFQHKKCFSTPNYKTHNYKMHKENQFEPHHSHWPVEDFQLGQRKNTECHFERPTSHRTNICIGDFLVSKTNSSDKGGGKKKKHKYVNLSLDEINFKDTGDYNRHVESNVFNIGDKNSFPEISSNRLTPRHQPRRRINPTRLNMSDHVPRSSNFDNSPVLNNFGVKCDKSEQNEAFKNQKFHPKEKDSNFDTERNILKCEKEKLLQKFNTLDSSAAKNCSLGKITVSRIATNTIQKKHPSTITVTPSPLKVTDTRALDILSFIYSAILDLNLVINFSAEINFLMKLLICQQVIIKDKNLSNDNENNISEENMSFVNNSNSHVLMNETKLSADSDPASSLNDECDSISNMEFVKSEHRSTSSTTEDKMLNISLLLSNIHNCVYFSLKTFSYQTTVLDFILDQPTMKMLHQNSRVKEFSPNLVEHFKSMLNIEKPSVDNNQAQTVIINKNVYFITDTDSEENFQTQQSFYSFKKQRDLFYEIFRLWENQHNLADWNFGIKLTPMIRSLLNMSVSPSNLAHLTRLFREQLIATCTGRKTVDEDSLPEVAGASADRLNKLAQRLVAAPVRILSNIETKPDFPDHQEFFRNFIVLADNAGFRQHLTDSFIDEIDRLNCTHFTSMDNAKLVNDKIEIQYINCVISLQLLGKFLGLLLSLPYRNPNPMAPVSSNRNHVSRDATSLLPHLTVPKEKVLQTDIHVRSQTQPPINILGIIKLSRINCRLILTVPWVVQLLAMLDYTTLRLPYYKSVLYILFDIYHKCNIHGCNFTNSHTATPPLSHVLPPGDLVNLETLRMTQASQILLKISIGWFFDMMHFPQQFFYSWIRNNDSDIVNKSLLTSKATLELKKSNETCDDLLENMVDELSSVEIEKGTSRNLDKNGCDTKESHRFVHKDSVIKTLIHNNSKDEHCDEEIGLDFLDIINCDVILNVCPHLKELKCLLKSNNEVSNGADNRTYRHITPVTSSLTEDTVKRNKERQIQIQLEEWFLRSQSQSTARVLRTVGERVGSALLRLVRAQIPQLKILSQFGVQYHSQHSKELIVTNEIQKLNTQLLKAFRVRSVHAAKCCARDRTVCALHGLLPPATAKPVFDLLVDLSVRRSVDMVTEWLNNNTSTEILSIEVNIDNSKETTKVTYEDIKEYLNLDKIYSKEMGNVHGNSKPKTQLDVGNAIHSGADCVVKMKKLCLLLVSGEALQTGIDEVQTNFEECLKIAEACSRCSYIQTLTKKSIQQISVDLVILITSLFPSLLTDKSLDKLTMIWKNCSQIIVPSNCKTNIVLNEKLEKKDSANHELFMFQKYMCDGETADTNLNFGNVNDSATALMDEEGLYAANNSFNVSQSCQMNSETQMDESVKVDNNLCENQVQSDEFFNTILCSRNVMYFGELGSGNMEVWKKVSEFLAFLLKSGFMTEESLTEQCLAIYRDEWPQNILENLSSCIKELSHLYKFSSEKLELFLDFVSEFCQNISGDIDFS